MGIVAIERDLVPGICDSKKLLDSTRRVLEEMIKKKAAFWHVAQRSHVEIDAKGLEICWAECIKECYDAAQKAIPGIEVQADFHPWHDAEKLKDYVKGVKFIREGDDEVLEIGAGSILAKCAQVDWMREAHLKYPAWGFAAHKGYGVPDHWNRIKIHGLSEIHRRTIADKPPKNLIKEERPYDREQALALLNEMQPILKKDWVGQWERQFLSSTFTQVLGGSPLSARQMFFLVRTAARMRHEAKKHQ